MGNKTRTLTSIMGNSQRLDGGAMFGNAPKALWTRWIDCDEHNRIPLCCRALLIEEADGRRVLLETGIGSFFEPHLRERYGVLEEEHVLLDSLKEVGLSHSDIDCVVLSHLHFDHAGGLLTPFEEGKTPRLLFPNAQYIVGEEAWQRACEPHFRDRASFIPALPGLLEESGRLVIVGKDDAASCLGEGYRFHLSDGHTPGLLLTEVPMPSGPVVFAGDLIPGTPWVHLPITMGYDRFAERVIDEKQVLLNDLLERSGRLFYTHDHGVALSSIEQDERGRFRAVDSLAALDHWSE